MMARTTIGRAARGVLVFLRGPCPSTAAVAAHPAEEMATLTPARHLVSEKELGFGARPAAAAASASHAAEEVDLLRKSTVGRRRSVSHYSRRPLKKTHDPSLKAMPWFVGTFIVLAFLEGWEVGVEVGDDGKKGKRN